MGVVAGLGHVLVWDRHMGAGLGQVGVACWCCEGQALSLLLSRGLWGTGTDSVWDSVWKCLGQAPLVWRAIFALV